MVLYTVSWKVRDKVKKSVRFEPHLGVDLDIEPKTVAIQETGQTGTC